MNAPCIGMQGKMLPSVTAEDNGDVLTVVDGEWSKASGGSGGGGNLVVTISEDYETGDLSADKTFAQISNTITNGQSIVAMYGGMFLQPYVYQEEDGVGAISFVLIYPSISSTSVTGITVMSININSDNVVSEAEASVTFS